MCLLFLEIDKHRADRSATGHAWTKTDSDWSLAGSRDLYYHSVWNGNFVIGIVQKERKEGETGEIPWNKVRLHLRGVFLHYHIYKQARQGTEISWPCRSGRNSRGRGFKQGEQKKVAVYMLQSPPPPAGNRDASEQDTKRWTLRATTFNCRGLLISIALQNPISDNKHNPSSEQILLECVKPVSCEKCKLRRKCTFS